MAAPDKVVILDFGSQYTQLIARRVREAGVYSEIHPCTVTAKDVAAMAPSAVILSGGPSSVTDADAPPFDPAVFDLNLPTLCICYGMQLLAHSQPGGSVAASTDREYGRAELSVLADVPLFAGLDAKAGHTVWMSHGDKVIAPPDGFVVAGRTKNVEIAALANVERRMYALQFHPEVAHTDDGERILHNFLFTIAGLTPGWTMASFVETELAALKKQVGDDEVVCALSGGVDSTVVAVMLHKAIGKKLHCIFVDNGLLRLGEGEEVAAYLREHFDLNLYYIKASKLFLDRLAGVTDPEKKRKIIGTTFIEVFEAEAAKLPKAKYLAQGTLYPDVIESESFRGPSAVIKSHHNVGGLPEHMKLQLIEPLRELFKDEVRKVAAEIGLPDFIIWRHPFPGPGLAIRIIGEVTEERLEILRRTDKIVQGELAASGWYRKVWQGFAVLLPLKTVGVMGDGRTYENVAAIRVVDSLDAMTADWTRLPSELLASMSNRIINEVKGVNRVVFDVSSKPPSTIEWE
ncbi:GMP synthase, large subunit [Solidesulfovibrio fructosivorans JJ]]|uniref:GMP synthase [glutamine-hydrolyzing] n=1 Tax=Solidesulfovibrio fructosivorans JJ] TaxID=596151 RepID=E1JWM1_SOLFR|nr:glutamine-hydrolyzing GMP synthase [Solidesulfovibrio fructosivorans]EFL51318.1 GMP synthase, large subunit [Solidesulfovibrio fructosivorans JJ]]